MIDHNNIIKLYLFNGSSDNKVETNLFYGTDQAFRTLMETSVSYIFSRSNRFTPRQKANVNLNQVHIRTILQSSNLDRPQFYANRNKGRLSYSSEIINKSTEITSDLADRPGESVKERSDRRYSVEKEISDFKRVNIAALGDLVDRFSETSREIEALKKLFPLEEFTIGRFYRLYIVVEYDLIEKRTIKLDQSGYIKEDQYLGYLFPQDVKNNSTQPIVKFTQSDGSTKQNKISTEKTFESSPAVRTLSHSIYKRYHLASRFNVVPSPWTNYATNNKPINDPNCVVDYLIETWCKCSKSTALSEKVTKEYFIDNGVTISSLMNFAIHKNRSLHMFTADGLEFFSHSGGKGRKIASVVVANNHVYTATDGKSIIPLISDLQDEASLVFSRLESLKAHTPDECRRFISEYSEIASSNWVYRAEGKLNCQALWWQRENEKVVDGNDKYHSAQTIKLDSRYVAYDMDACYYNIVMNIADDKEKIPVYSVFDCWESADETVKDILDMTPEYEFSYVYIGGDIPAHPLVQSRIMTYKEASVKGLADKITHIKLPSSHITVKEFRQYVNSLANKHKFDNDQVKDLFKVMTGMLGVFRTRFNERTVQLSETNPELDRELIQHVHEVNGTGAKISDYLTEGFSYNDMCYKYLPCVTVYNEGRFKNINNRNILNWIVSRSAIYMTEQMMAFRRNNPGARLVRMCTDSMTWNIEACEKTPEIPRGFHSEEAKWNINRTNKPLPEIDIAEIIDQCKKEITPPKSYFGPAGYGKSYAATNSSNPPDVKIAPTNASAININGKTIHKYLQVSNISNFYKRIYRKVKGKTIFIDEIGMVDPLLFNYIIAASKYSNIILAGDFRQLPPIGFRKIIDRRTEIVNHIFPLLDEYLAFDDEGQPDQPDLFTDTMCVMRTLKRAISPEESKRMTFLRRSAQKGSLPINVNTRWQDIPDCVHICYTNKYRNAVNNIMMEKLGKQITVDENNVPHIPADLIVIARETRAGAKNEPPRFVKAERFRCDKWDGSGLISLHSIDLRTHSVQIHADEFQYFDIGYCMTTHSVQGYTINRNVCIHESHKMDPSLLLTAVTRVGDSNRLHRAERITLSLYNTKSGNPVYYKKEQTTKRL